MDVASVAGASIAMRQQQLQQAVGTKVMKMGMDSQTQLAQQLIDTIPQTASIQPSYLGQKIDAKF